MVITVIAEPRSGSTNLANWFYNQTKFTTLYEPITNSTLKWFKNGVCPTQWKYDTEHLFVKEIYQYDIDYSKLLSISDKIIVLYRENKREQLLSFNNAMLTGKWNNAWKYDSNTIVDDLEIIQQFDRVTNGITNDFINNPNYFKITYESLYYGDGFKLLQNYISIDNLDDVSFPRGEKYAMDISKKTII
jgi:hypothetical protein